MIFAVKLRLKILHAMMTVDILTFLNSQKTKKKKRYARKLWMLAPWKLSGMMVKESLMEKIKDILLLVFFGTVYFVRAIIELPYLWVKEKFK